MEQSRQKSYADTRCRELTFEEEEYVYMKVSPIRGMRRFKVKGKLSPRYIGSFKILTRSKRIRMCKVQWSHHAEDDATWERKEELQAEFP